ncbi:MAG TPA: MFS transporter, partial [Acidimicrobiales bacterium]|nr:MFS transporter [Acidimicrobiales bacterium]
TTIVNVALPSMQRGLGLSAGALSWVLNAYILTFGGFLLLGARTGDLVGRRRAFLSGIALFSLSSLAGGLAVSGWALLAARALQGTGAALAAPSALSLLTTVFPEGAARVRAIALYTTVSAAGGATGLVAGGLLTELVSWRWVMFVNVPIGVAVWLVGRVVLAETARRRGRFDLAGALSSTLGMSGIVLGLVEAGSAGWTRPLTVVPLAAGVALLGFFVGNEARAEEPVLPLRLLGSATRNSANAARGLVYAGMYGLFFFMSQFLQDVQRYSPLAAGVAFLPMPASVFLASQLTSRVLVRRLPLRVVTMAGITLSAIGLLLATQLRPENGYGDIVSWFVLVGSGSGISFVTLTTASLHEVEPADAGAASGLINVSQQLGAALGLAVLVTLFGLSTGHAQLGAPHLAIGRALARFQDSVVGGMHDVFALGVLFTLTALALVAVGGRRATSAAPARAAVAGSEDGASRLDDAALAEAS